MFKVIIYCMKALPISFMMILFPVPNRTFWYNKLEKETLKLLDTM